MARSADDIHVNEEGHMSIKAFHMNDKYSRFFQQNGKNCIWDEPKEVRQQLIRSLDTVIPCIYQFQTDILKKPLFIRSKEMIKCYSKDNTLMGEIHEDTFIRLHNDYKNTRNHDPDIFTELRVSSFDNELISLLERYDIKSTNKTN